MAVAERYVRPTVAGWLAPTLIAQTPTTVLLCTHHVSEFETIADHIGVLRNNELCAQMPLHALKQGLRRYRAEIPAEWKQRSLIEQTLG